MILNILIAAVAVASSPYRPPPGDESAPVKIDCAKEKPVARKPGKAAASGDGLANLPYAFGHKFSTLDAYLAHLEQHAGPIDLPWWREIRPGVYQHVKRAPGVAGGQPEVATRAELMQRFGFKN